jgi:hypothetical protein
MLRIILNHTGSRPKGSEANAGKEKKTLPELIVFYDEYRYNALSISLHLLLYCPFPFALPTCPCCD